MCRDMQEVIVSQRKMLQRLGQQGAAVGEERLAGLFKTQLDKFDRWIAGQKNFAMLSVNYRDMIREPKAQCAQVNEFLEGILDVAGAAASVDPSLYRNRL